MVALTFLMPLSIRLVTSLSDTSLPRVISGTTTERAYPHDTLELAGRVYRVCQMSRIGGITHFYACEKERVLNVDELRKI